MARTRTDEVAPEICNPPQRLEGLPGLVWTLPIGPWEEIEVYHRSTLFHLDDHELNARMFMFRIGEGLREEAARCSVCGQPWSGEGGRIAGFAMLRRRNSAERIVLPMCPTCYASDDRIRKFVSKHFGIDRHVRRVRCTD